MISVVYKRFMDDRNEIQVEDLVKLCNELILSSSNPLMTSIQVAGLFKDLSNVYLADSQKHLKHSENFTQNALRLIDDFPSDQVAMVFLEQRDAQGRSPLSEAQRFENMYFFENPRVVRICEMIWMSPDFMSKRDNNCLQDSFQYLESCVDNPYLFFTSPFGKFSLRALLYWIFLISFSFTIAFNTRVYFKSIQTITRAEYYVYVQAVAFLMTEIGELAGKTIKLDIWHCLDLISYTILTFLFGLRIYLRFHFTTAKIFNECPGNFDRCHTVIVYMMTVSIVCILLWAKSLYIFVISTKLGPLLRMIRKMGRDLTNFFWIFALIWIGFFLAIYSLNREDKSWVVPGFENGFNAFLTTFGMFIGQFSFQDLHNSIDNFSINTVVSILYIAFAFLGMICRTFFFQRSVF
jgi:hypothetical protein